jgi:hypothetical protein
MAVRAERNPLLWMHDPFEMAVWTFRVHMGNDPIVPCPSDDTEQQRRDILAQVFQNDVQYPLVPVIMPVRGEIIDDENDRGDEENIPSVTTHEIHHRLWSA